MYLQYVSISIFWNCLETIYFNFVVVVVVGMVWSSIVVLTQNGQFTLCHYCIKQAILVYVEIDFSGETF